MADRGGGERGGSDTKGSRGLHFTPQPIALSKQNNSPLPPKAVKQNGIPSQLGSGPSHGTQGAEELALRQAILVAGRREVQGTQRAHNRLDRGRALPRGRSQRRARHHRTERRVVASWFVTAGPAPPSARLPGGRRSPAGRRRRLRPRSEPCVDVGRSMSETSACCVSNHRRETEPDL